MTWTYQTEPSEHITLTIHQAVQKDEQVFNSYGPKSNEDLLAAYGFVNEGMEDDAVTLKLGGKADKGEAQQHYWRYDEPCPPALLQEIYVALQAGNGQGAVDEMSEEDRLMQEGEAMDTVVGLLEQKIAAFEASQQTVEETLLQNGAAIRREVRNSIVVYRKSE